jgi:hypothetical protein
VVGATIKGRPVTIQWSEASKTLDETEPLDINNMLLMRLMPVIPHKTELFVRPDGTLDFLLVHQAKEGDRFDVPGSSKGLLYSMRAPDFTARFCKLFESVAIGSGADAVDTLNLYRPLLVQGDNDRTRAAFIDD